MQVVAERQKQLEDALRSANAALKAEQEARKLQVGFDHSMVHNLSIFCKFACAKVHFCAVNENLLNPNPYTLYPKPWCESALLRRK